MILELKDTNEFMRLDDDDPITGIEDLFNFYLTTLNTDYSKSVLKDLKFPLNLYWGSIYDSLEDAKLNDPTNESASGWTIDKFIGNRL